MLLATRSVRDHLRAPHELTIPTKTSQRSGFVRRANVASAIVRYPAALATAWLPLIAWEWWLRLGLGRSEGLFGEEAVAVDYGGGEVDEFAVVDS